MSAYATCIPIILCKNSFFTTSSERRMGGVASVTADAKGKGNECFKKGEYLDAIEAYTRALDCDQRDHTVYSNRCAARLKLGQNGFALKDAIVCVTLAPSWGKGYYRLGGALSAVGKHSDAVDAFLKAYALLPEDQAVKTALEAAEKTLGSLRPRGYVYTWGSADVIGGSTGTSSRGDVITPKPVDLMKGRQIEDLSCGLTHNVVVTAAGEVVVWGQNKHGQCGVRIPGEVEALKRPLFVPGLLTHRVVSAACGGGHTLVVTDGGKVLSWGTGQLGQLGHGTRENAATPRVIEGLAGKHVTGVACGFGHTIVALHDGACFAFGWNRDGQCGNGTRNDALVPSPVKGLEGVSVQHASCGGGHSAVISHQGHLLTFGSGSCGQLGHGQTDDLDQAKAISRDAFGGPLASVSCGEEYTIVVSAAREVFGFGLNNVGQLGGAVDVESTASPSRIKSLDDKGVELCTCTQSTVLAVTVHGDILTWGAKEGTAEGASNADRIAAALKGEAPPAQKGNPPTLLQHLSKRATQRIECGRRHFLVTLRGACAQQCTAKGEGLETGTVGKRAKFTVTAKDEDGQRLEQGADRFDVLVFTDDGDCIVDATVDDNMDGSYSCQYTASKAGPCVAWVRLGGVHISGSPFNIDVIPGAPSLENSTARPVFSDGTYYHRAGEMARIYVDVCDKGRNIIREGPTVSAELVYLSMGDESEATDAKHVNLEHSGLHAGGHVFEFTPTQIGSCIVEVSVNGGKLPVVDVEVIPGIASAPKCSLEWAGIKACTAGEDAEFKIVVRDALGNLGMSMKHGYPQDYDDPEDVPLTVRVRDVPKGGGGGELPVSLQSMGLFLGARYARGAFTARFTPRKMGDAVIEVMVGGKHIKGSPFTIDVQGGPASAMHCYVRDSDLEGASLRDGAAKRSFVVFACDKSGHRRSIGGDAIAAQLRGPGESGKSETISIKDAKDGTYSGDFTVKKAGRYWIEITLGGLGIGGSPYVIDFSPDPAEEVRRRHEAQERRLAREKEAEQRRKQADAEVRAREVAEEKERERLKEAKRLEREKERRAKQAEDEKRKESEARAAKAEKSSKLWDRLRKEEEARRKAVAIEEERRNAILAKLQESEGKQVRPGSATKRAGGGFKVSFTSDGKSIKRAWE